MFEDQIAKGVEYLDQDLGPSWFERIDLQQLEMEDCFRCVIGQLYSDFWKKLNFELGDSLGFSTWTEGGYELLTQEWKARISQLRTERAN